MPLYPASAALRQPDRIDEPGLLVGWSLETKPRQRPIGFSYGHPLKTPATGYLDPILLHGEGHLMTIAPTGAGKGTGCIIPALLRYPGPVIVIDPKGENFAITARRRREMGQRVVLIDPMGITDHPSDSFNPLDVVDIGSSNAVDEVTVLAQSLAETADGDPRSRFWRQRAAQLLAGVMLQTLQAAHEAPPPPAGQPRRRGDLMQVREMVNEAAAKPEGLAEFMGQSRHPEVRRIARMLNIGANETLGGIVSFAQEAIDFLRGDPIHDCVSHSSFDAADITAGKPLAIYLVLPPHMLESHGRLLRLWLGAFVTCITRRRARPALSTLMILDEAAQLGELAQLRQAVTLLRGYGLQTWSFWQDVSQLQLLYPRDWKTMVNNCKVLQCFGALNQSAAQDMSDLTGYGDGTSVLDLRHDEMLLQLAGDQAVIAQLPNYLTDPAFAGAFDANPYHQRGRDPMPRPSAPQRLYQRPADRAASPALAAGLVTAPAPAAPAHAAAPADDPLLRRLLEKWKARPAPASDERSD